MPERAETRVLREARRRKTLFSSLFGWHLIVTPSVDLAFMMPRYLKDFRTCPVSRMAYNRGERGQEGLAEWFQDSRSGCF